MKARPSLFAFVRAIPDHTKAQRSVACAASAPPCQSLEAWGVSLTWFGRGETTLEYQRHSEPVRSVNPGPKANTFDLRPGFRDMYPSQDRELRPEAWFWNDQSFWPPCRTPSEDVHQRGDVMVDHKSTEAMMSAAKRARCTGGDVADPPGDLAAFTVAICSAGSACSRLRPAAGIRVRSCHGRDAGVGAEGHAHASARAVRTMQTRSGADAAGAVCAGVSTPPRSRVIEPTSRPHHHGNEIAIAHAMRMSRWSRWCRVRWNRRRRGEGGVMPSSVRVRGDAPAHHARLCTIAASLAGELLRDAGRGVESTPPVAVILMTSAPV